jgi:hypothetical protein
MAKPGRNITYHTDPQKPGGPKYPGVNASPWRYSLLAAALLVGTAFGRGVDTERYQVTAVKISAPITLDGRLDERVWLDAIPASGFVQREPQEGKPSTEPTEVKVLYDDSNLYFGIICHDDEPGRIVANEMRRDAELRNEDFTDIIIDTYNDHRNAFYFSVNPLGSRRDALIRDEGGSINRQWDGIWDAKTARGPDGWTVEVAIPFHTLRFTKETKQIWGINFGRSVARKREESYWTPILRDYGFYGRMKVSYFGHLVGLEGIRQGEMVQAMPYIIGGGNKTDASAPFKGTVDAGLDMKIRLTSNVTADLTVNTDFAQVESDQEQFNLTPYSLFFPEKREFFLEGADIFRIGERASEFNMGSTLLFFSRTIGLSADGREVPVLGGAKITGKAGKYDLGILDILTGSTSYLDDYNERVDIGRTNYSVFRLKRDVFEKSSIGVIAMSKDPLSGGSTNRTAGLDFNLTLGQNFKTDGFLARTFTPGLRSDDWAGNLNASYADDFWDLGFAYMDIGENFNAEMGFVPRTDIQKFKLNAGVGPRPHFLGLRQSFFMNDVTYIQDHSGRVLGRELFNGVYNSFQNGSQLFVGYSQNFEYLEDDFEISTDVIIPAGGYKFNNFMLMFNSDRSRGVALGGHFRLGEYYNGHLASIEGQAYLRLTRNFTAELRLDRNQFNLPVTGGKFASNIFSGRFVYAFSPDLFAKAYVQWNGSEKLLLGNFLIRWIYKPGANIYFIYNENRILGRSGYLEDRTVMIKASFLFNF